jgi:zinc and cadmium transporter
VYRRLALFALLACCAQAAALSDERPGQIARQAGRKKAAAHRHVHDDHHDHAAAGGERAPGAPAVAGGRQAGAASSLLLGAYCLLLVAAAVAGGWVPGRMVLSHTGMQTIMSFVGGLMLGIAAFHMLPHALLMLGRGGPDVAARWLVAGLLVMFFLLRLFHFHRHDAEGASGEERAGHARHEGHGHPCAHDHAHDSQVERAHAWSWLGVFLGLALHTLIDGFALGASIEADAAHGARGLLGIGTFLAIFLHIPLDTVSISTLMAAGGYRPLARNLATGSFALLCPMGAVLFVAGVRQLGGGQPAVLGCALAFSAGVFFCIALSELLPEMAFHSHDRARLSLALLLGVALAWGIGYLEPAYLHGHDHDPAAAAHGGAEGP